MTREMLNKLGIEDADVISKVLDEVQREKATLKTELAQLKEDMQVKENLIKNKNEKIAELEKVDIETIKKEQYDLGKAEGSAEVEKFKFDNALEIALKEAKVRDSKAISGYLDREKLKFEEGKIVGLEDQINPLKESHTFLFEAEKEKPAFSNGSNANNSIDAGDSLTELRSIMGLKPKE